MAKRRYREAEIQRESYKWFCYAHSNIRMLLFAIPNGGSRNAFSAKLMKLEGVTAGVADMFLAFPTTKYHGLFMEFKAEKGTLTETQLSFKEQVEAQGYKYTIIKSSVEFEQEIKYYLSNN